MKHYPRPYGPARLEGLTHACAPLTVTRTNIVLFAAVLFAAGFFLGAISFGSLLVHSTDTALRAQMEARP